MNPWTEIKINKLKKLLPYLAAAPYTRLILLSGSVAAGTPRKTSDLDLIIVSENNKVWLNRFFLELATWLLGARRNKTKFEDRVCFNMFLNNAAPVLVSGY